MNTTFRLLIVEDNQEDAELMVAELVRSGFSPEWERVDSQEKLLEALETPASLILCDYLLPGIDALGVLGLLAERAIDVPVIVISGEMDEETCVKSLRMGAVDYLLKDRLARLGSAVEHALTIRRLGLEKREAERAGRKTANILRGLVAHAPAAISVKAVDGRYLLANPQFEMLCGLDPGTVLGRVDAEVFPAERARQMTELDARCLHTQMVLERELELEDASGTRNLLCVRYPVTEEGEVSGIGAIYLDITSQKTVEAQLRAARAEQKTRADALDASVDQLRELDRLKTEFISSVSHELRTPLTSIRGYLEMLRDGSSGITEEMRERFLAIIDRNSEHLLSLIEDLLILSRMDSGQYSALDRQFSVREIVDGAVSIVQPALQQAQLTMSVEIADDVPSILGDPGQLERVLINLLSNAIKFSAPDGSVEIIAQPGHPGVSIAVRDRGIGIPAEERHQLFTRFYRTAAARERGIPGTGLGLAVVHGIVNGHGGTVQVDSTPGHGTTMTVRLPAVAR